MLDIDRRQLAAARVPAPPVPQPEKPARVEKPRPLHQPKRDRSDNYEHALLLMRRLSWAAREGQDRKVAKLERHIDRLLGG